MTEPAPAGGDERTGPRPVAPIPLPPDPLSPWLGPPPDHPSPSPRPGDDSVA